MSRIRSIHPGLWTDDAFMALSPFARLLIIGLWNEAFDDGVFEWKPRTIKARIFPGDNVEVPELLAELVAGDFIMEEIAANERSVGLIRNFRTFQRPKKPNDSQMLRPEWRTYVGLASDDTEQVPHQDGTDTEKPPQMEDGGGKREDEDIEPPASVPSPGARDEFDELLEVFPRNPRCPEERAEAAWRAAKAKDRPLILAAARRHALAFAEECEERQRTPEAGKRYEPFLATWIESGAWKHPIALKADANMPDPSLEVLPRNDPVVAVIERKRGKPFPWSALGERVTVKRVDADAARLELAVH
jgi:hypothetical protein